MFEGLLFLIVAIVLNVYWESSWYDYHKWKDPEYQKRREVSGCGEISPNGFAQRCHRKYGYKYDPWYPAKHDRIVEDEYRFFGISPTEKYDVLFQNEFCTPELLDKYKDVI